MIHTHHPRGAPQLPAAAIKYWVVSENYDVVGGLSFFAASWQQAARDQFIGWNADSRKRNLMRVMNNARYLILPWIRIDNLASHILSQCEKRIADN